ncbi:hypothetical protein [Flaviflagellibacter deserti]|jgi:hypothetical protein|uniref:Uncharacterized protein n=1 Tax=Flaviflagellibacter deserti TaxID=2267266 RepID=A0ABV9Z4N9_9HYPH
MQHDHEFQLGDQVEWIRVPLNVQRGPYEITRQLPEGADGTLQYRMKSPTEVTERVVTEKEISHSHAGNQVFV